MKIALITVGVVVAILVIAFLAAYFKEAQDRKAREAEYQEMLARQKRRQELDNDPQVQKFRANYAASQKPGIRYPAQPRKSVSPPVPRKKLKAREDGVYVEADTGSFDAYWIDDTNDRVSDWTSTTDSYTAPSYDYGSSGSSSSSSSDSGSSSSSSSDSGSTSTSSSDF